MDEMEKNNKKAERKSDSCCDLPNMKVVKGLLAVFLGVLCLMLAHKVIVSMYRQNTPGYVIELE